MGRTRLLAVLLVWLGMTVHAQDEHGGQSNGIRRETGGAPASAARPSPAKTERAAATPWAPEHLTFFDAAGKSILWANKYTKLPNGVIVYTVGGNVVKNLPQLGAYGPQIPTQTDIKIFRNDALADDFLILVHDDPNKILIGHLDPTELKNIRNLSESRIAQLLKQDVNARLKVNVYVVSATQGQARPEGSTRPLNGESTLGTMLAIPYLAHAIAESEEDPHYRDSLRRVADNAGAIHAMVEIGAIKGMGITARAVAKDNLAKALTPPDSKATGQNFGGDALSR